MLIAILLAGRWVGRRLCAGYSRKALLAVGMIAAALVLAADLAVGVGLRGMSVTQVFTGREPGVREEVCLLVDYWENGSPSGDEIVDEVINMTEWYRERDEAVKAIREFLGVSYAES